MRMATETEGDAPDLRQRRLLERRRFWIRQNGIEVEVVSPWERQRYTVPFSELGTWVEFTGKLAEHWIMLMALVWFVAAGAVATARSSQPLLGPGGMTIAVGLSLFLAARYAIASARFVGWSGPRPVLAFRVRASSAAVNQFFARATAIRNDVLTRTFGVTPADTVADALTKLYWLNERGALTDAEFTELKASEIRKVRSGETRPGYV
jgi:hypothetical protein